MAMGVGAVDETGTSRMTEHEVGLHRAELDQLLIRIRTLRETINAQVAQLAAQD
jgi:hypothetical protein